MPSHLKMLCLGQSTDIHTKTQIGTKFAGNYHFVRVVGWIWSSQDDDMIPLYGCYSKDRNDYRLQTSTKLGTPNNGNYQWLDSDTAVNSGNYQWWDFSRDKSVDNKEQAIIGYIYDLAKEPDAMHTVELCGGSIPDTGIEDSMVDNSIAFNTSPLTQDHQWKSQGQLGWIIPDDTEIGSIQFDNVENSLPLVIDPLVELGNPVHVPPTIETQNYKFDLWNRLTGIFVWDYPTRVAPNLEFTTMIPVVKEKSASASQISIPDPVVDKNVSDKVLTTQVSTLLTNTPLKFNTGEVNELGYDSEITATLPIDGYAAGEKSKVPMLVLTQMYVSVRFKATITWDSKVITQEGTYEGINTTCVTAYAIEANDNDHLRNALKAVEAVQLGKNNVVQYPELRAKQTEDGQLTKEDPSDLMVLSINGFKSIDDDTRVPLLTFQIAPTDYNSPTNEGYYNNVTPMK